MSYVRIGLKAYWVITSLDDLAEPLAQRSLDKTALDAVTGQHTKENIYRYLQGSPAA